MVNLLRCDTESGETALSETFQQSLREARARLEKKSGLKMQLSMCNFDWYVCMYVCVDVCVSRFMCVYVSVYMCVYMYMYVLCGYICVHLISRDCDVYVRVCKCVHMYV